MQWWYHGEFRGNKPRDQSVQLRNAIRFDNVTSFSYKGQSKRFLWRLINFRLFLSSHCNQAAGFLPIFAEIIFHPSVSVEFSFKSLFCELIRSQFHWSFTKRTLNVSSYSICIDLCVFSLLKSSIPSKQCFLLVPQKFVHEILFESEIKVEYSCCVSPMRMFFCILSKFHVDFMLYSFF